MLRRIWGALLIGLVALMAGCGGGGGVGSSGFANNVEMNGVKSDPTIADTPPPAPNLTDQDSAKNIDSPPPPPSFD